MSTIDRQRVAAVRHLEAMGYVFRGDEWVGPAIPATFEVDAIHALLVLRADAIEGFSEGSDEERELAMISEALESYEAKRWPEGKVAGCKGVRQAAASQRLRRNRMRHCLILRQVHFCSTVWCRG